MKDNDDNVDNGANRGNIHYHNQIIAALVVSAILLSSTFVMALGIQVQEAYAAKGGKGGDSSESDKDNGGAKGKSKSTTNTTTSDKEDKSKHYNGDRDDNAKSNKGQKSTDIGEQNSTTTAILAKAQKLKSHKLGNETIDVSWPYSTDTTYLLEANGTAKAIGDNKTTDAAAVEISVEMSIWKTTKNLVSMDIMNGSSITVDDKTMEFYSGQAHYLPNKDKMLLVGFIMVESHDSASDTDDENDNNEGSSVNQTGTGIDNNTNQTSTSANQTSNINMNQTSVEETGTNHTSSTQVPSDDEEITEEEENELNDSGPALRHVKLWIRVMGENESLPSDESSSSETTIEVLSPQSKIASEWFLQMSGEMYYTSS